jgi:hypothetical protein
VSFAARRGKEKRCYYYNNNTSVASMREGKKL